MSEVSELAAMVSYQDARIAQLIVILSDEAEKDEKIAAEVAARGGLIEMMIAGAFVAKAEEHEDCRLGWIIADTVRAIPEAAAFVRAAIDARAIRQAPAGHLGITRKVAIA